MNRKEKLLKKIENFMAEVQEEVMEMKNEGSKIDDTLSFFFTLSDVKNKRSGAWVAGAKNHIVTGIIENMIINEDFREIVESSNRFYREYL